MNNYAQVIVEGAVSGDLRYYKATRGGEEAGGSLEFQVDDGTEVIKVRCYDDATRELIKERKIPAIGDKVVIHGTFQSRGRSESLILGSTYGLTISRKRPDTVTASSEISVLLSKDETQTEGILIEGKLISSAYNRFRMEFMIDDGSGGTILAYLPGGVLDALGISEGAGTWEGMPQSGDLTRISGVPVPERGKNAGFSIAVAMPEDIRKVQ
ncbi:MAG: hypothetical protein PHW04_07485 [Candidatus Wallbacteria bacterium]|nr:hypothetical protein [Candidatus Wallbacteria bacterium]